VRVVNLESNDVGQSLRNGRFAFRLHVELDCDRVAGTDGLRVRRDGNFGDAIG
jgi:hypothetical protein